MLPIPSLACFYTIPGFFIRFYWRAGASQPSRSTGTIFQTTVVAPPYIPPVPFLRTFLIFSYGSHAVMFYVFLNIRRTKFCITRCSAAFMQAVHAGCQRVHAVCQCVRAGCQFSPTSWCGSVRTVLMLTGERLCQNSTK